MSDAPDALPPRGEDWDGFAVDIIESEPETNSVFIQRSGNSPAERRFRNLLDRECRRAEKQEKQKKRKKPSPRNP